MSWRHTLLGLALVSGVSVVLAACGSNDTGAGGGAATQNMDPGGAGNGTAGSSSSSGGAAGSGGSAMSGGAGANGGSVGANGGSVGANGGSVGANGGSAGNASACAADADCRLVSNYCGGCNCLVLGKDDKAPQCAGQEVNCFADPCTVNKGKAACVNGHCALVQ